MSRLASAVLVKTCLRALLLLTATAGVAFSQTSRAPVRVFLNDQDLGVVIVLLEGDRVWMPVETLSAAGIRIANDGLRVDRGAPHVPLDALPSDVTATFDPENITVRIVASTRAFGARTIDARHHAGTRAGPLARASSAFINYSAFRNDLGTTVAGELGVGVKGAFFSATAIKSPGARTTVGPVRLTLDDARRLNRWVAGDQFVPAPRAGSVPLVGVSFSRAFEIDPYFVPLPALEVTASTAVPASVDVYINDQLVRRERVDAGTFTIEGLTPIVGEGQTRVVVRDALGREREYGQTFYQPAELLADGVQAFSYAAGQRRDRPTGLPAGPWLASATHRVGVSDSVTIGGHASATPKVVSGGPQVALRLPRGELELGVSVSAAKRGVAPTTPGKPGGAALVGYNYRSAGFSAGGFVELTSRDFADASPVTPGQPRRSEAGVFAGGSLGSRVSVTGSYGARRNWNEPLEQRGTVNGSVRLSNRLSASVSVGVARGPRSTGRQVAVGLTLAAPRNNTVTMNASRSGDREPIVSAGVQRSLPLSEGYGYRLQVQEGAVRAVSGAVQAQTRVGRIDATTDSFGDVHQSSIGVAGAIAMAGGGVHFTRTIDDAFAVIQVPGQGKVRAYVDGQLVGRTNRRGNLVVPHLLSYHDNRITIAHDDLSLDTNLDVAEQVVSPGLRNGPTVRFAASRTQRIMGRARRITASGATEPLAGDLFLAQGAVSPLGRDGQFYFENLRAGTHGGLVMVGNDLYRCNFDVTPSNDGWVMLGDVVCKPIPQRQP
jgi:outer membrane usher protein